MHTAGRIPNPNGSYNSLKQIFASGRSNEVLASPSSKETSLFYRDIVCSKRGQMHDLFFSGPRARQLPGDAALPHDDDTVSKGLNFG
jgi:hypothetical protein